MADTSFHLLRQRVGGLVDGEGLVGTPDGGYTTTTFNSAALATYEDDFFNDWHGRFYAGTHKGTNFEVTDFAKTSGVVTFSPALAATTDASDKFELYQHFTPREIGNMINIALSLVDGEFLISKVDESVRVPSATTYEYLVPPGFAFIDQIFQEQDTAGRYGRRDNLIDIRHWRILPGPSRIWFDPAYASLTAGRRLRLIGQGNQPQLSDDDDLCSVNQGYVIYQAKALLHESRIRGQGSDFEAHSTQMALAQTRADSERDRLAVTGMGRAV
tara:strand:- start:4337 stop:5152 length:816 start_codon:yes stop_codon:yes gene_type:complete